MKALERCVIGFVIYFMIIPGVWSLCVMGSGATSDSGGEMIIHYVRPWPDTHFYAYKVTWLHDGVDTINVGGNKLLIPQRNFDGWCYVDECNLK